MITKKELTISMTTIMVIILSLLTSAQTLPFDQCIQVVDSMNGNPINDANCYFTDSITIKDNVIMTLTNNGIYCTNINNSYPLGIFNYQISCTANGETKTFYDTINITNTGGCTASYTLIPMNSCQSDNTYILQHTSSNETCQLTYNTTEACNYCNPNINANLGICINGTQTVNYTDNNYASCCLTTGLAEDCIINDPQYNPTTQSCIYTTQDINCTLDTQPVIHDKMNINCELPTDEPTCCTVNVYQGTNYTSLLQSNPEYKSTSNFVLFPKDQETRTCFTPTNRLLNAYYTNKEIRPDTTYKLEIKCANNITTLNSQYLINPNYATPDNVLHRIKWVGDNPVNIIITILAGITILAAIIFVINKVRG